MAFTIEFRDGRVLEWHATESGTECRERDAYTPTIYASADSEHALADLEAAAAARGDVCQTSRESWRPAFRRDAETVCRLDVTTMDRVQPVAGWIRRRERPGTYRLFNVDFSPEFRYCLECGVDPVPDRPLRTLELTAPGPGNPEAPVEELMIEDEPVAGAATIVETLRQRLTDVDPDVLVVSEAGLVPALTETAAEHGQQLHLGRRPGYEQLATASTYEHYGQTAHSPARYAVPGRVLIDRSNTFFYEQANLAGCLDLVERSRKPLQELSWASIGNVLTAIQIREALARGVLVPWQSWRHEFPKTMRQLHEADRGGFTFTPEVGVHEQVHELDFSSLYPNIICTRNISPETIRCPCHDTDDVPGLGYSICPEPGYLPDVLQPIIDDRDEIKSQLEQADSPDRNAALDGQSAALKWILVSCFGYQGFSNAKFGRIECHEAINAVARQILLDAKAQLEDGGWRVVHGIVDSLWVTAREDATQQPLDQIVADVTQATEIRLEYEGEYDWIAFVPRRSDDTGALTTYFGRRTDGSYKYRGIECRQRSTSEFVADCQRSLVERFDRTRDPEAVCLELSRWLRRLEAGTVSPERLAITVRTSKPAQQYRRRTRTTAALERSGQAGFDHQPGQDVQYVVVDDDRDDRDRVRLAHESVDSVDSSFYRERLLRAAESVLSPSGWRVEDIEAALHDHVDTSLSQFG
ncbi:type B DNA-directed DNA polymerase [Halovenus halobia]|uniref:type B DNA-directed DNA polymerase n=1 Tax=Halovenus halobia TaxID=3396622 RepID=UPI003F54BEE4